MLVLLFLLVLLAKLWSIFLVGVGKKTNPTALIQQQITPFIQNLTLKEIKYNVRVPMAFQYSVLRASEEDCHVSGLTEAAAFAGTALSK